MKFGWHPDPVGLIFTFGTWVHVYPQSLAQSDLFDTPRSSEDTFCQTPRDKDSLEHCYLFSTTTYKNCDLIEIQRNLCHQFQSEALANCANNRLNRKVISFCRFLKYLLKGHQPKHLWHVRILALMFGSKLIRAIFVWKRRVMSISSLLFSAPFTKYIWERKIMLSGEFFSNFCYCTKIATAGWSRGRVSDCDTSSTGSIPSASEYLLNIRTLYITYTESKENRMQRK